MLRINLLRIGGRKIDNKKIAKLERGIFDGHKLFREAIEDRFSAMSLVARYTWVRSLERALSEERSM